MKHLIEMSIVIPAYNEESRIEPTIHDVVRYFRLAERSFEVIVVDDGSRDRTAALIAHLLHQYDELRLIRLPINRGKGYAVRTGVVNTKGSYVLFTDADGSTPISEIERLDTALQTGSDIAIGSRALEGEGVQVETRWYRRLIGRAFHLLVNSLAVRGIKDTQCGFKLFRSEVAHDLFSRMRMNGFSFDVELLLMAQRRGYGISEVPINWEHRAGSRVNLVLDSLRMARDLLVMRGNALRRNYDEPHLTPMYKQVAVE